MEKTMLGEINRLRCMSVAGLQAEWLRLYGEVTCSRNHAYLWRRLSWRVQELAHGGLSGRAKQRIEELAPVGFVRARTPSVTGLAAEPAPSAERPRPRRDPRMPVPGSVISKQYKGRELRVTVRDDGYEFDGAMFVSLTAIAKDVTGSKNINGKLFFGLTGRKR